MASIPSSLIDLVISSVRPWVEPPAPYVTEAKSGSSGRRASSELRSVSSPAGVFGGKNSNEKTGSSALARISSIRTVPEL